MGKSIKILFLVANPADTGRLRRAEEEIRGIQDALRQSEFRNEFVVVPEWAVRVNDIQKLFLLHKPNIVHFSGHGSKASEIILEDNNGNSQPVPIAALSNLFSVLKNNIRCVVLNACYSEHQAKAIAKYIDCVIGMSRTIKDEAAINFAIAFYQALGYGENVKTAFDSGCLQIHLHNLKDQDKPQLLAFNIQPEKIFFVRGSTFPGHAQPSKEDLDEQNLGNRCGLRSQPLSNLSEDRVKIMLQDKNFFSNYWNSSGRGIKHEYEPILRNGIKLILDSATGLMWQQSGSSKRISYNEAIEYVKELKNEKSGGYNNWRLPSLEEAMSLVDIRKYNNLHIASMFNNVQEMIWTTDQKISGMIWCVDFGFGRCFYYHASDSYYVRAVRIEHKVL